ncbi:38069_t:CDS:2 [Gigaspora margarita]|uniref:38069_t:CDS:1 n=1 Tax=Gigaspora margarita TaxID=4874 RepID=A0ABN7UVL1_GIGMA|nr:38069_t:CDS:2 [Gigaspora margarita]
MPVTEPLNETERFSEENSAKRTLTKKTSKTRNSIAMITNDREDRSNRIELEKKREKQNEQEIKLIQDENLLKKDTYTWSNGSTATRIDQIWISEDLIKNLYKAEILDMYLITESDHSTVLVNLKRILYVAKQNIPFRKIPNSTKKTLSTNKKTKFPLQKDTISISKICQELKKLARENKDQKAILALSSKRALTRAIIIRLLLYKINVRHKTNIDLDETVSIEK